MAEVIELGDGYRMHRAMKSTTNGIAYHCQVLTEAGEVIVTTTVDLPKEYAVVIADAFRNGYQQGMTLGARMARTEIRRALGM